MGVLWRRFTKLSRLSLLAGLVAAFFNFLVMQEVLRPTPTTTVHVVPTVTKNDAQYQPWKNDYNVVHVIQTRFMQHQPTLLHLGRARLVLFENFCLKTIVQQTSQQFLWIIRVDPRLHSELKESLINLVRGHDNIVVVDSNMAPDLVPFRDANATIDIKPESLWYGSIETVRDHQLAGQNRTVLESGLDADDGLALDFVDRIQRTAAETTAEQEKPTWWRFWCSGDHSEWHFFVPYVNYPIKGAGFLKSVPSDMYKICITPGLTRGTAANVQKVRISSKLQMDRVGNHFFERHDSITGLRNCSRKRSTACWGFLPPAHKDQAQAIRSRTPTSAGMKGLATEVNNSLSEFKVRKAKKLWEKTMKEFAFDENKIRQSTRQMQAALPDILSDALAGQCTVGHSCKNSSVKALNMLLKTAASSTQN